MSGFRISPLQPRIAGSLKGFGFTIEFSHSSAEPLPAADEESRTIQAPSDRPAPSYGQD